MSEQEIESKNLTLKRMFGGTNPNLRKEAFYEENFPAIKELSDRGVIFYQVTATDFFQPVVNLTKEGKREEALEILNDAKFVCQLGDDRSKKVPLMTIDLGGKPALTEKDKRMLAQRSTQNPTPRIGMSWNSLGIHIDEGIAQNGELIPEGFDRPLKKVIGFVNKGGAKNWQDADLNDIELFSKLANHFCKNESLDKLELEITIVEGTSSDIDREISNIQGASSTLASTNLKV